ncbi:hypothetical protein [Rhizobium leguminosarum]|uniref:hypothetical protein n=1 Tax=Rhizobium leguminosarum TaxID=384 RepID=UPI001C919205|nr:hypothetical protein [Rhizobium leguminosarum]MBY2910179.1 hypothetical protein [Rhizobium leguminosarum]
MDRPNLIQASMTTHQAAGPLLRTNRLNTLYLPNGVVTAVMNGSFSLGGVPTPKWRDIVHARKNRVGLIIDRMVVGIYRPPLVNEPDVTLSAARKWLPVGRVVDAVHGAVVPRALTPAAAPPRDSS